MRRWLAAVAAAGLTGCIPTAVPPPPEPQPVGVEQEVDGVRVWCLGTYCWDEEGNEYRFEDVDFDPRA